MSSEGEGVGYMSSEGEKEEREREGATGLSLMGGGNISSRKVAAAAAAAVLVVSVAVFLVLAGEEEEQLLSCGDTSAPYHVEGQVETLSTVMWDRANDLLPQVWESKFIKGVKDGTLDPNFYGAYLMQDAAWCKEVSKVFEHVSKNESAPQVLRDYAKYKIVSYLETAKDLWKRFTVKEDTSILGDEATSYAKIIQSSTTQYGAPYIVIATYACSKLWDNMTADLITIVNSSNPYYIWVNESLHSSSRHAAFIDTWASEWYDWNVSIALFRQAMGGEIGLFNMFWQWPSSLTSRQEKNLSSVMWNNAIDLLLEVWNTKFIKGVKDGTLDPNFYTKYSMQDAAWCKKVSKVWEQVSKNESAPQELRAYANTSIGEYLRIAQVSWDAFNVEFDASIIGNAATNYANLVQSSTTQYGSPYIVIATYACSKLWDNITIDLGTIVNASNPYSLWVSRNSGSSSEHAAFIDTWASKWYDWNLSIEIFREAMRGEIGLFNME